MKHIAVMRKWCKKIGIEIFDKWLISLIMSHIRFSQCSRFLATQISLAQQCYGEITSGENHFQKSLAKLAGLGWSGPKRPLMQGSVNPKSRVKYPQNWGWTWKAWGWTKTTEMWVFAVLVILLITNKWKCHPHIWSILQVREWKLTLVFWVLMLPLLMHVFWIFQYINNSSPLTT